MFKDPDGNQFVLSSSWLIGRWQMERGPAHDHLMGQVNLKERHEIVVVNAPKSFAAALKALPKGRVQQPISNQGADVCAGFRPALADRQIGNSGEP
jgi:hypothetical protein